jgi:YegS/Rv2252/BmrU family lipid kinase
MERAVIVYNPASRKAPKRERLERAAAAYRPSGWQIELRVTEAAGHGVELAREASREGASVVFACGGDGTLNEVVNGLAGSSSVLGLIRGGMGDVFGKEAGISKMPEEALKLLVEGERRRFDLGKANERYFILMAGVGFDAGIVRAVPSRPKRVLGSTSYALWGALALARYRARSVILKVDGEERESRLYWLLLGNTRSYGGVTHVASKARVDDGLLDAYVFEGHSPAWLAGTALRIALERLENGRGVRFERVRELEVISLGLPVQVDGEYIGETPMRFTVAPSAVEVLLPSGRARELFGAPSAEHERTGSG